MKASNDRVNIMLDIDNTLLCAEATEGFDFAKEKKCGKPLKFKFHDMDHYYIVFERPHVQEFLTHVFENYNVSIWTAASKDYALFIIDNVILKNHPERMNKIDFVFYSYHCGLSSKDKGGTKNLSMLWDKYKLPGYTKDNTFIMDDYEEVKETNGSKCVLVEPFEYFEKDSENDDYLRRVTQHLKQFPLRPGKNFLQKSGLIDV